MRFPRLSVLLMPLGFLSGGVVRAQGPLTLPVPFTNPVPAAAVSASRVPVTLAGAQRAQDMGFASLAAGIYRQLMATAEGDLPMLTLALAGVLLDDGKPAEAEKVLADYPGPHGSAWHLRAGLAAVQLRKVEPARAEFLAIRTDELSAAERPWASFLLGALYDLAPVQDITKANEFYSKGEQTAPNEMARARMKLAAEQVRLALDPPNEATLRQAKLNYDANRSRGPVAYGFAETYAVLLARGGKKEDAATFLRDVLLGLPPQEHGQADRFRLLLGLIGNTAPGGAGRAALNQLIATGGDPERQRVALQLLAKESQDDVVRGVFRAELNKLIDAPTKHPILEALLLFRAQVALADKDYAPAEKDARRLLDEYPGSPFRVHALGVLTASAWEQRRYRAAADNAHKARDELAPGKPAASVQGAPQARAELLVLEAEAWFRAGSAGDVGDFRSAADAYAAALRERPEGVRPGDLMFQRVLSEIKAGAIDAAQPLLDELARNPEFDLENRWRAEWNLVRALQLQGDGGVKKAYARVNALLLEKVSDTATKISSLPAELLARMAWLQARLALDANEPERAIKLADEIAPLLAGVDETLRNDIASRTALVKAEANFALEREADALKTLQTLRDDPRFAKSDAAAQSYLIEAGHYVIQEKTVDAQKLYTRLADGFPTNDLAPYALLQAAEQATRRGQEANYKEANQLIENLVTKYPRSDYLFKARMLQGDLLRNLNQLPTAQQTYEDLVNKPASQENLILAQLALAQCHNAQSAGDPSHFDMAKTLFEHLCDRADASVDVRVEAGYNLGELWVRRDDRAKALEVWWTEVVNKFLLDEKRVGELGAQGRFWMARTLLRSGEVAEQQGQTEGAKRAWQLLLKSNLGWEAVTKERLERYTLPEAKQ